MKSDESKLSSFSSDDIKDFNTAQRTVLLDLIGESAPYPSVVVKRLDEVYGIHGTENAEIRLRFYVIALRSGKDYAEKAASESRALWRLITRADVAEWVINKGRMKFCRPIFRLLLDVDPELARRTFKEHASFYVSHIDGNDQASKLIGQHPIARKQIAKDLGVEVDLK